MGTDEETVIAFTVGYMLKVCKSNKDISDVIKEFNCIKHGNYNEFIQLIGGEIPYMIVGGDIEPVVLGNGNRNNDLTFLKNECDMIQLFSAAPSMNAFLKKCYLKHGNFIDNDISDEVYKKLALFEIRIRVHASNKALIEANDTLEQIIDKLSPTFHLTQNENIQLHKGRKFLNKVKHNENSNYNWSDNTTEFLKAYDLLTSYRIKLI